MTRDELKELNKAVDDISQLEKVLPILETAMNEKGWRIKSLVIEAPAEGSSCPAGSTFEVLPAGPASEQNSMDAIERAYHEYYVGIAQLKAMVDKA